ncbi:hypothetical protein MANY_47460 [Mycolicibacterium anyangense]|uniref:DUF4345 domain-containing protein n=1 Tax=Mycolicibacterium anyangense TaxID=1431246 RepID=A0A6N4WE87_9MYCO|nr:hypothetical protein [Mycolicibacterium anyangense]BBZ79409.1 hypothetical protein MANY_47460 [Mycolicibacterium anyangense]
MTHLRTVGIVVALVVSAVSHGYLYLQGYRHIPLVGFGFLALTSVFVALAVLITVGGPVWLRLAGATVALAALGAFVMSRTVGLLGFVERGWQPQPHALISVFAELTVVGLTVWSRWGVDFGAGRPDDV